VLNAFDTAAGIGAIVLFGLKGAVDADLPITKAPNPANTENGKGGSVRSRI
jgi:photosystem I subunit VI